MKSKELKNKNSRRAFLKNSGLTSLGLVMGAEVIFASHFPKQLEYVGMSIPEELVSLKGKDGRMIVLNDRPINAETPPHLLDPELTLRALQGHTYMHSALVRPLQWSLAACLRRGL